MFYVLYLAILKRWDVACRAKSEAERSQGQDAEAEPCFRKAVEVEMRSKEIKGTKQLVCFSMKNKLF